MHLATRGATDGASALLGVGMSTSDLLPLYVLIGWIVICVTLLARGRPQPSPHEWPVDRWLPAQRGPRTDVSTREARPSGDWRNADPLHCARMQVIEPDHMPTWATSICVTLSRDVLEDVAGPVLDAGHMRYTRHWSGVLLHGASVRASAELARGLAGEHGVRLVVVRAREIAPADFRPVVRTLFEHVSSLAPCVVLIEEVDGFADVGSQVVSSHARRIEHELATGLRSLSRDLRVVVLASAVSIDRVPDGLLAAGCFDRAIAVDPPSATQRGRLLARVLLHRGARFEGDAGELVRLTEGLYETQLTALIAQACRVARARGRTRDDRVVLSRADVHAALPAPSDARVGPLAIGRQLEQRLHDLRNRLGDEQASVGVALIGLPGNGKTTIARWLTTNVNRAVVWLGGDDVATLEVEDVDVTVAGATALRPVVVVLDGLDDVLTISSVEDAERRKALLIGIEHLARTPGGAVIVTLRDPTLVDEAVVDERLWIPSPSHYDRIALIKCALGHAALLDTTPAEIAERFHGRTRSEVVDGCRAAIHAATLRHTLQEAEVNHALPVSANDFLDG